MAEIHKTECLLLDEKYNTGLVEFLVRNEIEVGWYRQQLLASSQLPRHIRINPFPPSIWTTKDQSSEEVKDWLEKHAQEVVERVEGLKGEPVSWLSGLLPLKDEPQKKQGSVFSIPGTSRLVGNQIYEDGSILGLDAASCFAIMELSPKPGEKVIDLCCAPGAKLCLLADAMLRNGTLVGVDVSMSRLRSCISMVRKYRSSSPLPKALLHGEPEEWKFHVFCADSVAIGGSNVAEPEVLWDWIADETFFGLHAEQEPEAGSAKRHCPEAGSRMRRGCDGKSQKRTRLNKSMRARVAKNRKAWESSHGHSSQVLEYGTFDRVLVDAECTHDGSLKHMEKYNREASDEEKPSKKHDWNVHQLKRKFIEAERSEASLKGLQCGLLMNGLRLLRTGGTLVYSTCSFSRHQNEDVVNYVLDEVKEARAVPLEYMDDITNVTTPSKTLGDGGVRGVYFNATKSNTSGLFVCKLTKV